MNTDTPPRLDDELRSLADLDKELALTEATIRELLADHERLRDRRQALNSRLAHYFRSLPPHSVIRGAGGEPYVLHMGKVLAAPSYSAATAAAIHRGDFPAPPATPLPAEPPRGPFGFPLPLPYPAADTPEAAEFGPAASAAAIDGETA